MAKGLFGGGKGTPADPLLIEDAYDLAAVRFGLDKAYKLVSNINLGVPPFDQTGWTPIAGTFTGRLDGNNHKIFNLVVTKPEADNAGLFATIGWEYDTAANANGKISCLSIENAKVAGRTQVGILAGSITCTAKKAVNITDNSALVLDNIHVSGSIIGQSQIGGLAGTLAVTNGANNWRLVEDCLVNVALTKQSSLATGGLLFGAVQGEGGVKPSFKDCICRGQDLSGSMTTNIWSAYSIGNNVAPQLDNCAYDSTLWNGQQTIGHLAKTADKMVLKEEFPELETKKNAAGASTWIFSYGRFPQLSFLEGNNLFVVADGIHYTYEAASSKWLEKYRRTPTYSEALRDGMKSLEAIDREAWQWMKSSHTNVEIVNIVDKSAGLTIKDNTVTFERDDANDYGHKQIYKKAISLDDFDHGIFMMDRAVNE